MANNKKTVNPSEAALSAIEQALNLMPETNEASTDSPTGKGTEVGANLTSEKRNTEASVLSTTERQGSDRPTAANNVANDDRENIGAILQALQLKPRRAPFVWATLASIAWIGLVVTGAAFSLPSTQLTALQSLLGLASLVVPSLLFFAVAALAYRAESMRLISQAMAAAAVRMTQPEGLAAETITSLGQAVRREVAAMGDGIERALSRAAELETIVHKEMASLERNYRDNDTKLRALVEELVSQRDAIAGHGEKIRISLATAHDNLTHVLTTKSENLVSELSSIGDKIAVALSDRGEKITLALGHAGEQMLTSVTARGEDMTQKLSDTGEKLINTLSLRSQEVDQQLTEATRNLSEAMESRSQAMANLITERGAAVEQAIEKTGQEVRGSLETATEQLIGQLQETSTTLVTALTTEAEGMNSRLQTTGDGLIHNISNLGQDMVKTLAETSDAMTSNYQKLGHDMLRTLTETSETLTRNYQTSGQELTASLSNTGEDLLASLSNRAAEVEASILGAGSRVVNSVTEQLTALDERLSHAGNEIVGSVTAAGMAASMAVSSVGDQITTDLRRDLEAIEKNLIQSGENITTVVNERLVGAQVNLDAAITRMDESIAARTHEMESCIIDRARTLDVELQKAADAVRNSFTESGATVVSHLADAARDVMVAIGQKSARMTENLQGAALEVTKELEQKLETFQGNMGTHTQRIEDAISVRGIEVAEKMAHSAGSLERTVDLKLDAIVRALTTDGDQLISRLDEQSQAFNAAMERTNTALTQTMDERIALVTSRMAQEGAMIVARVAQETLAAETRITGLLGQIEGLMKEDGANLADRVAEAARDIDGALKAKLEVLKATLEVHSDALVERLASQMGEIDQTLLSRLQDVDKTLSQHGGKMAENLSHELKLLEGSLAEQAAVLDAKAKERYSQITETVDTLVGRIGDSIDTRTKAFNEQLAARSLDIFRVVNEDGRALVETLDQRARDIAERLTGQMSSFDQSVSERSQALLLKMDEHLSNFQTGVVDRLVILSEELDTRSRDISGLMVGNVESSLEKLETTASKITQGVGERTEELSSALDEKGSALIRALQSRTALITSEIAEAGQSVVVAFEHRSREATEQLNGTILNVKGDLEGFNERLSLLSQTTVETLNKATETTATIETSIASKLLEIEGLLAASGDRSERLAELAQKQIADVRLLSSNVMGDISTSVTSLEEGVQRLATAAKLVEETRTRLDASLTERGGGLEALVTTIGSKTDDMDAMLKSFSALVEEQLQAAEQRTRSVGNLLTANAEATVQAINEQFDLIRLATGKERERTASALRSAYDQAVGELGHMLTDVSERFQDITRELRNATLEIHRDLESTRGEFRRHVTDLPQEASEAANAMRRVVTEQIKALNELGQMVTRQPRTYDISANTTRSLGFKDSNESAFNSSPIFDDEDEQEASPQLRQQRGNKLSLFGNKPEGQTQQRGFGGRQSSSSTENRSDVRKGPILKASTSEDDERSSTRDNAKADRGWLGELLSRAGREEQQDVRARAPQRTSVELKASTASSGMSPAAAMDVLNALEKKASRLVDPAQVLDMWENYLKGQRPAFSKRLCTAEGLKAAEDLRKRYQSDKSFRQVVDNYLGELEPLVMEASEDERKGALAKTFLGLDQGKLFTLLAYASGRVN